MKCELAKVKGTILEAEGISQEVKEVPLFDNHVSRVIISG